MADIPNVDGVPALNDYAADVTDLLTSDGEGDWREINEAAPKIQAVTAADVKRVANQYFTKENRAVAIYTRKPGASAQKEPSEVKQ